jgi:hypothetical protein
MEPVDEVVMIMAEEVAGVSTPVRIILTDGSSAVLPADHELQERLRYLADSLLPPSFGHPAPRSEPPQPPVDT